jgi:hypothetical protein
MRMYCKVFLDSSLSDQSMVTIISRVANGSIDGYSVTSDTMVIDVEDNEDFDEIRRRESRDGFLFYRYYLDIKPTEGVTREEYIKSVGNLLESLWQAGYKAVAACDFESELPRSGGYKTSSTE